MFGQSGKFKASMVMFDLDGTLIDSVWIYYEIVQEVMKRLKLPTVPTTRIREANRNGTFLWEKLFPPSMFTDHPQLKDEAWSIARDISSAMFEQRVELLPGAATAVKQLAAAGLQLAIVTSTPRQNMPVKLKPLEETGILDFFTEIMTADDTTRKKPAADPLIECCRRLKCHPQVSVYIGDTRIDIQAGQAAGSRTIGVLTGFDDQAMLATEHPDAIIENLGKLTDVIAL